MVSKSRRDWNTKLAHTEFAYNQAPVPIHQELKAIIEDKDTAKEMKKLQEQVRSEIEKVNK